MTLEQLIGVYEKLVEHCEYSEKTVDMETLRYLKMFRDMQEMIAGQKIITYWGGLSHPVIKIGEDFFCIQDWTHKHDGCWRSVKIKPVGDGVFDGWFVCDDDNYLIDRNGRLICREIGWELREEPCS